MRADQLVQKVLILKSVLRVRSHMSKQRVAGWNAFHCQYWTSREKQKDSSAVLFINSTTEVTFLSVGSLVCVQELCKNYRMEQHLVAGWEKGRRGSS